MDRDGEPVEDTDTSSVRAGVAAWCHRYDQAWHACDIDTIVALTDPALCGTMVMADGTTRWEASVAPDTDGVRDFFAFMSDHDVSTSFETYDIIERSHVEAIAVRRKTVSILDGDDPRVVTQVSLDTVRKGVDGKWRLVRYWAEKAHCHQEEISR